jgi:hypothetical protein
MNRAATALVGVVASSMLWSSGAMARDDVVAFPIADVMGQSVNSSRLEGVQFFFGNQPHPAVAQNFGSFPTNKKTNAFNKSDKEACNWAFLSALLSFHQRAISVGGNAVIDIQGNYKNNPFSSTTDFQCGVGATVAGVTLTGTVVKLQDSGAPMAKQNPDPKPQPAKSSSAQAAGGTNKYDELAKLDELRKKGVLTEEEFQAEKKRILSGP